MKKVERKRLENLEMLPPNLKKTTLNKLVVVSEEERFDDDFKAPTKYYIIDAYGNAVFVRTRDRGKAQSIVDSVWGKGFYTVRCVVLAQTR